MAYCTIELLKDILPKNITIGTANSLDVTQGKANVFSQRTAGKYINLASQFMDSRLSTIYATPISRIKIHEEVSTVAFSSGQTTLTVADNGIFVVGAMIRVTDSSNTYVFRVADIPDSTANITEVVVEPKSPYTFATGATISVIEYPAPISDICSKLAASFLFDREFVAQQEPDISNYGKSLLAKATSSLDKVMSGAIRLNGQDHVGRRFVRTSLRDTWSTTAEVQAGSDKE